MQIVLTVQDRNKVELNEGDIVAVSDRRGFRFYAEVKYLGNNLLAPFSTFSFHSFEKVDKVPDSCVLAAEPRYKVWYEASEEEAKKDEAAERFESYLMEWRECEHMISMFRLDKVS